MSKVKQKSHSGAKKRFRVSKSGRVKARSANCSHNTGKKPSKLARQRTKLGLTLCEPDAKTVRRLLLVE